MKENWTDIVARKVAYQLLRLQNAFAELLEKKTADASIKHIRFVLIFFCLLWGGISFLFIGQAILFRNSTRISIDRIDLPQHALKTGEPKKLLTDSIENPKKK